MARVAPIVLPHKKGGNRITVRHKGVCSCGMRTHSEERLLEHIAANGHELVRKPSISKIKRTP